MHKRLHNLYDVTLIDATWFMFPGVWGVGLATPMVRVDSVPLGSDQQSWVLTSEGTTVHNGEVISRLKEKPAEGDILVSAASDRGGGISNKIQSIRSPWSVIIRH